MRIAFYAPRASHLDPDLARGGDPIFLRHLLDALERRGHEVLVISRFNVRDLWRGRIARRRLVTEARRLWAESRRFRPDVWLVYDASRTYPDLFGWWQRSPRYVLLSAHPWQSERLPRWWRPPLAFAFGRSLTRADAILAARPTSADGLRELGADADRIAVLPPAVPRVENVPGQAEARGRLGLDPDASVVLSVGRFTGRRAAKERKTEIAADVVRAATAASDDAVLVLVGDGPGRPAVEEEIARLNARDRVHLAGAVPYDELRWFFAACDVYAYPDQLDRPRLSVLDAQACGRPVVTMDTPSARLIVEDGRTGVLVRDRAEFDTELAALIRDRARCRSMGRAAREYVAEFHSIDVRARQIELLLTGDSPLDRRVASLTATR